MGRLFWKFFFFIWLAQLSASFGVGAWFWWEREQDHQRHVQHQLEPQTFPRPPLPELHGTPEHPPPEGHHRPPPPLGVPTPVLIAAFLASLLFAVLLARYISKPIQSLQKALAAAAAGELSVRPGLEMGARKDELADLGIAFDQMAAQLRAVIEAQKQLLGDVSHELRSPLARMQVAIGLARQQPQLIDKTLERLERESYQMDTLIGELLTISRLDGGSQQVEEDILLPEVLLSVVEDVRFEWADQPIHLLLPTIPEVVFRGDGQLLQRAIENVVRNAVKFSLHNRVSDPISDMEANSCDIEIRIQVTQNHCLLQVLDQGPGVPDNQLANIFKPFVRYQSPETTGSQGVGLGLAIAQAVVNRMGGHIKAHNRALETGGGLCVEIALPLAQRLT